MNLTVDRLSLRPLIASERKHSLPIVQGDGTDVAEWAETNGPFLHQTLAQEGGVLLRGFTHSGPSSVKRAVGVLGGAAVDYRYGVSPRTRLVDEVYTSTELDPKLTLPLHSELSFSRVFPRVVGFLCVVAAETGGQTPIASNRNVMTALPARIARSFADGVTYIRNYPPDERKVASWKRVFESPDPDEVSAFCEERGLTYRWVEGGWLHTKQRLAATRVVDGEEVWFNQAHLFHSSTIGRRADLSTMDPRRLKRLPRNALHADERRIPTHVIRSIRRAYDRNTVMFDWEPGDLLILDNLRFSHGRMPFEGPRKVLVAMGDPVRVAGGP